MTRTLMCCAMLIVCAAVSAGMADARTFRARDYGAVADGVSDAGPGIRAAIAAAAGSGEGAEVLLEAGEYRVKTLQDGRFAIALNGARGFTLRGIPGRTRLVFTNPDSPAFGVFGCSDTFLKGFSIDYDPTPFTQGTVVAIDKSSGAFDMEIDAGYPLLSQPWFKSGAMGVILDRSRRRLKPGAPDFSFVDSWTLVRDRVWRMKLSESTADRVNYMSVGDAYVHLARLPGGTIEMNRCTNCGLEDVTMYASPGLSLLLAGSETATALNRFQVRFKPGSNRLIASDGDGVHAQQNRRGPVLDGCYFEGLCDDGVNIYCPPSIVRRVLSETETEVAVSRSTAIRAGDRIQVYDLVNGAVRAETTVSGVREEGDDYILTLPIPVSGVRSDRPADHIYNLSACGAGFVVRNSVFSNHRRHGLNIRGIDGIIEGNRFDRVCGFGVSASNEPGWPEGPIPSNLTFRGNTFIGGADSLGYSGDQYSAALRVYALKDSGLASDRVVRRVCIEGNTFIDPPNACVFLGSVRGALVRGNTTNGAAPFIVQWNSAGVTESGNKSAR